MQKIAVELSTKQAEWLLDQLSPAVKIRLVRRWEHQTWPLRFRRLLAQIDQRVQRHPKLSQDALKAIEPARRAFYASRRRR